MSPGKEGSADELAEVVREEFSKANAQYRDDARALEVVALELELSLDDCAAAIGREDLLARFGESWKIEFPAIGPPAFRRI